MANTIDFRTALDGPACLQLSQSNTASGGIANADHTLLLVAWDSAEETDINFARCLVGPSPAGTQLIDCVASITTTGANDTITATWTPPKRKPHHYSMYRIAATSYTRGTSVMSKILPAAAERLNGNIPGYATSATFYSITSIAETRDVEIDSVDAVADTYTVRGNYLLSGYVGATVNQNDGGGNQTVDAVPTLQFTSKGVQTVISVSTSVNASATRLRIIVSNILWPASDRSLFKAILNPVNDFALTPRERLIMDTSGLLGNASLVNDSPYSAASVPWSPGNPSWAGNNQTAGSAAANYQVNFWNQHRIPVELAITSDSDVMRAYQTFRGKLTNNDNTGLRGTEQRAEITVNMAVDRYRDSNNHYIWYDIAGSDNTSADSFDIDGDQTAEFYTGRLFYVRDSNANDGLYAVAALGAVYDGSTHVTRVYVTGTVTTDASATGRVELWD